jgi:hypothetical protein
MWKNIVERGRPQMAIWRMRIACWIPKATNTHLQYVIFTAFHLQRSHERASLLRYTYIACIVIGSVCVKLSVPQSTECGIFFTNVTQCNILRNNFNQGLLILQYFLITPGPL